MKTQTEWETWDRCYDDSWRDDIVPKAFAHPAKMARGLLKRIIEEGILAGYWRRGSVVGEPFFGIGTTGILGAYYGLRVVGVELEPRFCSLAQQNIELHRRRWELLKDTLPVCIQGDSRRFAELVGSVESIVTSPPHADSLSSDKHGIDPMKGRQAQDRPQSVGAQRERLHDYGCYGTSPGQIGRLPPGDLDAVITSPPYVSGGHHPDQTGSWGGQAQANEKDVAGYGQSPGQIGQLPAGSLDAVVTSPPYAANEKADYLLSDDGKTRRRDQGHDQGKGCFRGSETYGDTPGQIGREQSETYWTAMAQVYAQCRLALKPGGVMAVVVKGYVKKGQYVDLPNQTAALLESLGFTVFRRVKAMLVEDVPAPNLFGGPQSKRRERKSFFRRLAEKKGSPPIDFEAVLFAA